MIISLIEQLRDIQEKIDELVRHRRDLNLQLHEEFENARALHLRRVAEQRNVMSRVNVRTGE